MNDELLTFPDCPYRSEQLRCQQPRSPFFTKTVEAQNCIWCAQQPYGYCDPGDIRNQPACRSDCQHLGALLPDQHAWSADKKAVALRLCARHQVCTLAIQTYLHDQSPVQCCAWCPDYVAGSKKGITVARLQKPRKPDHAIAQFTSSNLAVGLRGLRFNTSIARWQNGYLLAYRTGWYNSDICLAFLDDDLQETAPSKCLDLLHPDASYGREDPRLFFHDGAWHVSFIGVVRNEQGQLHTNVLYARLTENFDVEAIYHPTYPQRNFWEKNWIFFSHEGQLYAVYSIAPHRILKIDGAKATLVYDTPTPARWSSGEPRGGSTPILTGDEYWTFFHSRHVRPDGVRCYDIGVYTFEAKPPFRILRFTPTPIDTADMETKPADQYAAVLFPCGAVLRENDWLVSMGVHDRWTEIRRYGMDRLAEKLECIALPHPWYFHIERYDRSVFYYSYWRDEYRLRRYDLNGAAVLDLGAYIGTTVWTFKQLGAAVVHAYEPDKAVYAVLQRNCAELPGVRLFNEAIAASSCLTSPRPANEWCRGFLPDENGATPGIPLDEAIARFLPEAPEGARKVLKIDIEGAEWLALPASSRLKEFDLIVGEWHRAGELDWRRLADLLEGFEVVTEPAHHDRDAGLFWAERKT